MATNLWKNFMENRFGGDGAAEIYQSFAPKPLIGLAAREYVSNQQNTAPKPATMDTLKETDLQVDNPVVDPNYQPGKKPAAKQPAVKQPIQLADTQDNAPIQLKQAPPTPAPVPAQAIQPTVQATTQPTTQQTQSDYDPNSWWKSMAAEQNVQPQPAQQNQQNQQTAVQLNAAAPTRTYHPEAVTYDIPDQTGAAYDQIMANYETQKNEALPKQQAFWHAAADNDLAEIQRNRALRAREEEAYQEAKRRSEGTYAQDQAGDGSGWSNPLGILSGIGEVFYGSKKYNPNTRRYEVAAPTSWKEATQNILRNVFTAGSGVTIHPRGQGFYTSYDATLPERYRRQYLMNQYAPHESWEKAQDQLLSQAVSPADRPSFKSWTTYAPIPVVSHPFENYAENKASKEYAFRAITDEANRMAQLKGWDTDSQEYADYIDQLLGKTPSYLEQAQRMKADLIATGMPEEEATKAAQEFILGSYGYAPAGKSTGSKKRDILTGESFGSKDTALEFKTQILSAGENISEGDVESAKKIAEAIEDYKKGVTGLKMSEKELDYSKINDLERKMNTIIESGEAAQEEAKAGEASETKGDTTKRENKGDDWNASDLLKRIAELSQYDNDTARAELERLRTLFLRGALDDPETNRKLREAIAATSAENFGNFSYSFGSAGRLNELNKQLSDAYDKEWKGNGYIRRIFRYAEPKILEQAKAFKTATQLNPTEKDFVAIVNSVIQEQFPGSGVLDHVAAAEFAKRMYKDYRSGALGEN